MRRIMWVWATMLTVFMLTACSNDDPSPKPEENPGEQPDEQEMVEHHELMPIDKGCWDNPSCHLRDNISFEGETLELSMPDCEYCRGITSALRVTNVDVYPCHYSQLVNKDPNEADLIGRHYTQSGLTQDAECEDLKFSRTPDNRFVIDIAPNESGHWKIFHVYICAPKELTLSPATIYLDIIGLSQMPRK